MEEETREEIYREIMNHYFLKADTFFLGKWCGVPRDRLISEGMKKKAIQKFYEKIKKEKVASRPTVQKWFGINGEKKPTRTQVLKVSFALKYAAEECNDCLLHGISEPELQVNDYVEFIAMYCLDHHLSYQDYDKMLAFFEQHYSEQIEFRQTTHTEKLKQCYRELREAGKEEFLLWMCQHMDLFKGYSKVTQDYFVRLMDSVYDCIRTKIRGDMQDLLVDTGFLTWARTNHIREEQYKEAIVRYAKNELRHTGISDDRKKELNEMRYFASIIYSSRSYMKHILVELCRQVTDETEVELDFEFSELKKELKKMDAAYISNLLTVAEQKEETLRLSKEKRSSEGEKRDTIEKKLSRQKQRVKQIQRKDLLIPAQYICQSRYIKSHGELYDREEAQREFVDFADPIMEACGMRPINPEYELDYILLQCYGEWDMGLFAEVFEE